MTQIRVADDPDKIKGKAAKRARWFAQVFPDKHHLVHWDNQGRAIGLKIHPNQARSMLDAVPQQQLDEAQQRNELPKHHFQFNSKQEYKRDKRAGQRARAIERQYPGQEIEVDHLGRPIIPTNAQRQDFASHSATSQSYTMGFANLRVDQLAEKCRERGLPDKGNKNTLLATLRADERAQQELAALQYNRENYLFSEPEYEPRLKEPEPQPKEDKYPLLDPLHNPQHIFERLSDTDLLEICEQNETQTNDASTQDWNCLSVQAKYRDKAEAAQQKRDETLKIVMAEIMEEYAKEMATVAQGLAKEMGRFDEGNMEFATKKMNWTYASEELEARRIAAEAEAAEDAKAKAAKAKEFAPRDSPNIKTSGSRSSSPRRQYSPSPSRSRSPYRYSLSPSYSSRSKSPSPPEPVTKPTLVQPRIRRSPSVASENSFVFPTVPAFGSVSLPIGGPAKSPTTMDVVPASMDPFQDAASVLPTAMDVTPATTDPLQDKESRSITEKASAAIIPGLSLVNQNQKREAVSFSLNLKPAKKVKR